MIIDVIFGVLIGVLLLISISEHRAALSARSRIKNLEKVVTEISVVQAETLIKKMPVEKVFRLMGELNKDLPESPLDASIKEEVVKVITDHINKLNNEEAKV